MIVRKIGNVTVYDDFKFSDSMNRVENLRIDLKQTFINQLIFAAMYIGISFFIMIFTVGYVHEITFYYRDDPSKPFHYDINERKAGSKDGKENPEI